MSNIESLQAQLTLLFIIIPSLILILIIIYSERDHNQKRLDDFNNSIRLLPLTK